MLLKGDIDRRKSPFKFSFDEYICENTMLKFSYLSPEIVTIITLVQSLHTEGEKNLCAEVIKVSASLSDCMILYPDQLNKRIMKTNHQKGLSSHFL